MTQQFSDKILVIDDEVAVTSIVMQFLGSIGITDVDICTHIDCFKEVFRAGKYQMVIVDLHLTNIPNASGFEIIQAIRRIDQDCIIIVITGHPTILINKELINSGIDDFLLKPLKLENFAYRVLLNLARAHRQRRFDLSIRNRYDERIESLRQQAEEITAKLSHLLLGGDDADRKPRACQGVG